MELKADLETFDTLQEIFAREIIEQIRLKLMQAGIAGDELRDITGEIAFSVTSTIDGIAMIEKDGVEVHPYLTFAGEDDTLIHNNENSFSHELIANLIGEMFKK